MNTPLRVGISNFFSLSSSKESFSLHPPKHPIVCAPRIKVKSSWQKIMGVRDFQLFWLGSSSKGKNLGMFKLVVKVSTVNLYPYTLKNILFASDA